MPTKEEARRLAEAMKPTRGGRAPAPEEPDEDPLLGADAMEDPGDDVGIWKQDAVTRGQLKKLRGEYLKRANQLFALALQSTDPRIAAIGGQINGLRVGMAALGEKQEKPGARS